MTSSGIFCSNSNGRLPNEYKCDLCQVFATSEQSLNDHLKGIKHKKKEKALLNMGVAKKPYGVADVEAEDSKVAKCDDNEENEQEMAVELRDYYKCWCVYCSFGTHTEALMDVHVAGKKHKALFWKKGGSLITIKTTPKEDVPYIDEGKKNGEKEGNEEQLDDDTDGTDTIYVGDSDDYPKELVVNAAANDEKIVVGDSDDYPKEAAKNVGNQMVETSGDDGDDSVGAHGLLVFLLETLPSLFSL